MEISGAAHAMRWPQLAELAAGAAGRTPIVREVAARYTPAFGDMSSKDARLLTSTTEEILSTTVPVPLHSTEPGWAAPMLRDGFRWQRWRDPVDNFEPYEDKLQEWNALGAGERSEDFIFAGLRLLQDQGGSVRATLLDESRRARASWPVPLDRPHTEALSTGFGHATLAFEPTRLIEATMLPAVKAMPWFGTRPATIEHLPALLGSRLAGDHGFLAQTHAGGLRTAGNEDAADKVIAAAPALRHHLLAMLRSSHDERVGGVRALLAHAAEPGEQSSFRTNPIEAHLRGVEPRHVVAIDVEPAKALLWPRSTADFIQTNDPRSIDLGSHLVSKLWDVVHPPTLDDMSVAARQLHIPIHGADQQRAMVRAGAGTQRAREIVYVEDKPASTTAHVTAAYRRQMAAVRESATAPA